MIWVVFAGLTALAMLGLMLPLMRPGRAAPRRAAYDLAVYRDQFDEIGRDIERGLLSPDQAETARTEIKRRMLAVASGPATVPDDTTGSGWPAWLVALGVPFLAFGTYLLLGSPHLPDQPYADRADEIAEIKRQVALVETTLHRLEEKVKADPGDAKSWAMLGRTQRALGRAEAAKESYRRTIALRPDEVESRVELAGLLIEETQATSPEAVSLLRQVLEHDPDQPDALYFVAQAEAAAGNTAKARTMLEHLAKLLPAGSSDRNEVEQQIQRLK